jgi:1-deoxyxylulose-5-phosphate synthase
MNYRKLGTSNLYVSPIGIGGNIFGYICQEQETRLLLDFAREQKINFIDTADVYSAGESERLIGQSIKNQRDQWVIATKVGLPSHASPEGLGRKENIFERVDQSLKRLCTDYIDLYQIHHFDPLTELEETLEAFEILIQQGKIRYAGCSNYNFSQLSQSTQLSTKNHCNGFVSVQSHYNLFKRQIEKQILPFCSTQKVGVLVYGALGRGVLSEKYLTESSHPLYQNRANLSQSVSNDVTPFVLEKVQALNDYAKLNFGTTVKELALAWLLHHSAVSSLIIGMRTLPQLAQNIAAASIVLSEQHLSEIDEIVGELTAYTQFSFGSPNLE